MVTSALSFIIKCMNSLSSHEIDELGEQVRSSELTNAVAALMWHFPKRKQGEFVQALVDLAQLDAANTERLFIIAITAYDKHFPKEHTAALAALYGLSQLLESSHREDDLDMFLQTFHHLIMRAARGISGDDTSPGRTDSEIIDEFTSNVRVNRRTA